MIRLAPLPGHTSPIHALSPQLTFLCVTGVRSRYKAVEREKATVVPCRPRILPSRRLGAPAPQQIRKETTVKKLIPFIIVLFAPAVPVVADDADAVKRFVDGAKRCESLDETCFKRIAQDDAAKAYEVFMTMTRNRAIIKAQDLDVQEGTCVLGKHLYDYFLSQSLQGYERVKNRMKQLGWHGKGLFGVPNCRNI